LKLPSVRHHTINSEHLFGIGKTAFGGAVCVDYDHV